MNTISEERCLVCDQLIESGPVETRTTMQVKDGLICSRACLDEYTHSAGLCLLDFTLEGCAVEK